MVGVAGFEPTTTCPPDKCATRLRYTPLIWPPGVVFRPPANNINSEAQGEPGDKMAESVRFELTVPFGTLPFQDSLIGHSSTTP